MSMLQKDTKKNLIIGSIGILLCGLARSLGHPEISQMLELGQDLYDIIQITAAVITGVGSISTVYAAMGLVAKYTPLAISYIKQHFHQLTSNRPINYLKNKFRQLFGHKDETTQVVAYDSSQNQVATGQKSSFDDSKHVQKKHNWHHTLIGRLITRRALENQAQEDR